MDKYGNAAGDLVVEMIESIHNNHMPKSLITGGAGFIGSHVARHCLQSGHEVVVVDDLSGGFEDHIPEGAIFLKGSVTDEKFISHLFSTHR